MSAGGPDLGRADVHLRDRRVAECLRIVIEDKWIPGKTDAEVAERWGTTRDCVRQCKADALRIVRIGIGADGESLANNIMAKCDELYRLAKTKTRIVYSKDGTSVEPDPDVKGAVQALRLQAQLGGVLVHRHEHKDVTDERERVASMSDEQLEAYIASKRAELHGGMNGNGKAPPVH